MLLKEEGGKLRPQQFQHEVCVCVCVCVCECVCVSERERERERERGGGGERSCVFCCRTNEALSCSYLVRKNIILASSVKKYLFRGLQR